MLIYIIIMTETLKKRMIMTDTLKNKMIKCLPVELTRNIIAYNLIKLSRKIILSNIILKIRNKKCGRCNICNKKMTIYNIVENPSIYHMRYRYKITSNLPICNKCDNIYELREKNEMYYIYKHNYGF